MEGAAVFLAFRQVQQPSKEKLSSAFMADPSNSRVVELIKYAKKGIRLSFSECQLPGVYIVMVRGTHDGVLIKLGRERKMPRGFPILWIPLIGLTRYFGFLPKFSNDERQRLAEYTNGVESIRFFKKWSGFLGQLLVFEYQGTRYYTVCSKNSADASSEYVMGAKRLFDPFITPALVTAMIQQNLHICAEIMSKDDQTHGARVLRETPVVTVVGRRVFERDTRDFVEFLTHSQVVELCVRFGLPCDSAITFNGSDDCRNFMRLLSADRDFMDNDRIDALIRSLPSARIERGTVNHSDILGVCLEGLVFFITSKNGSIKTEKFKCPRYTIRTMLFRPELEQGSQGFWLHSGLKKKAEDFADFWCVSDIGRRYWINKALEGFLLLHSGFTGGADPKVGLHIEVGDYIAASATGAAAVSEEFAQQAALHASGTVIVVVGPIGSGKTTIMNQICDTFPDVTEPIDGDVLGLTSDITMNLKGERSAYSLWKITEVLMRGRTPVISTGGGVLVSSAGKKLALRDAVYNTLKTYVNIIVFVPSALASAVVTTLETPDTLDELYDNMDAVKKVVRYRVNQGTWNLPEQQRLEQFASFIAGKSKQNKKFAEVLIANANKCFTFPALTRPGPAPRFDFSLLALALKLKLAKPVQEASFQQVRVLVDVFVRGERMCIGHITLLYDESRQPFTLETLKSAGGTGVIGQRGKGRRYDLTGSGNASTAISFVIPDRHFLPDGRTHITIDPGPHTAKEMVIAAQAVASGAKSVTIDEISYEIDLKRFVAVDLHYIDVFGI